MKILINIQLLLVLFLLPFSFSIAPKASLLQFKNFTANIFALSQDGRRSVFSNYSVMFTQNGMGTIDNITLKIWEINDWDFNEVGYHVFQFQTIFVVSQIYWIGQKIILLGTKNEYFIASALVDGLVSKEKVKLIPQINWYRGSMLRLKNQENLTFFAMSAEYKSSKYYISKAYLFKLVNEQINLIHQCAISKTYGITDYFHSVFLLKDYYCLAAAYPNSKKLIVECCSSQMNTSIITTFENMQTFKSAFRIAPILQTYEAYLVYQNAYIQKILFNPISRSFMLISLNLYVSKSVEGALCLNGNLIEVEKDGNQIIVSFYNQITEFSLQIYERITSPTHLTYQFPAESIDRIRLQSFPNQKGVLLQKLQISDCPYFFVKFLQKKQEVVGLAILLIFLAVLLLISTLYCIKSLSFTRIKLITSIKISQIVVQIICYILVFTLIFLKVIATDTTHINFGKQSTLGSQTLSGSFWLRLIQKSFIFFSILITINEIKPQYDYSSLYMQNHIRHGLQVNSFISLVFAKLILKCLTASIISFAFIAIMESNYNQKLIQILQIDFNLLCAITTFTISMISFALLGKLISKFLKSYWKTLSILFVLMFGINNWSDLFYRDESISNLDQFLVIVWIPSLFKSYLQLIYQAEMRFIQPLISQIQLEMILFFHFFIVSLLYIGYMKWIERINKIDRLINSLNVKQQDSKINYSGSNESSFYSQKLEPGCTQNSLLNVYIPIKMNLKNRLQKNKVLEDIRFEGKRGEVLGFIDEGNQSRVALFKILTGQQKSDQIIELGLVGKVSYSEKVKVSYCLDYDLSFPDLTVQQHLEFYYWLKKPSGSKSQMKSQVQHILDEFQISDDFRIMRSRQLSGGYLKKMCLACAFVGDPDVVILDQPTLGLDVKFQKLFQMKVKAWKQNKLLIIFTANHDEADALSDKVWYFQNQRLLRYEQAKKKYQKVEIKLQFLTQNAQTILKPAMQEFIKDTFSKGSQMSTHQVKKWLITIDKPYKQGVNNKIKQFMSKVTDLNSPNYMCHFDYRMVQSSLTRLQLLDKYSGSESFCNNCDGHLLYEHLKAEQQITSNHFQGISIGEDSRTRQSRKAQKILSILSSQLIQTNLWISQIRSVFYRRWKLNNLFQSKKREMFFAQLSLWISWIASISTESDVNLKNKLVFNFLLYFILHLQVVEFYVKEKEFGHFDYYKSIGLDWVYYWVANILYDFFYFLIPLLFANIALYTLQNFGIISIFEVQIHYSLIASFLLAFSYSLFQILLSLFLSKSTQKYSLLFTILLFPFILQFDPYFASFGSQELGFGYFSYFFFAWSVNKIVQQNKSYAMYYQFFLMQIFVMVVMILIIEQRRESFKQKEGHAYLGDFSHSNNDQTLNARRQIQQIQQKSQFVLGEDIVQFYGNKVSLRNVSFYVKKGEILGVFGHNGSGKTTIFKIIVRRLSQSSGVIQYFGKRRQQLNIKSNIQISYCPQTDHFDPNLSLQQNLIIIGKIKGLQAKYLSKFITVFLGYMGLKGNEGVLVRDLSVCQRKKAHFVAAFLGFPKLIVCDQISTGVDNESSKKIMAILRSYSTLYKKCVILTSHNIHQGEQYCDRAMILKNGTLIASNTAFQLRMDVSQQLYKIIISFKREDNQILRARKKQKVILFFKGVEYKKSIFEDEYFLVYSIDMREQIGNIFESTFKMYLQGFIDKFSFYKHDLEEVSKTHMNTSQEDQISQ